MGIAVATQQALRWHYNKSWNEIAKLTGVHPRTAWQHVMANKGANVRPWSKRTPEQKAEAIREAGKLIRSKR